ncbi:MAG: penicillin-binding protein 2 [bacterium]
MKRLTQITILLFGILTLQLINLQIIRGNRYASLSERNRIRKIILPAPRGRIYDRNSILIADTRPSYTITVIPTETNDSALALLASIINQPLADLKRRLKPIVAFPSPITIYRNANPEIVARVQENNFRLPGVLVRIDPIRNYPYCELYSHVIGHLGEITEEELVDDSTYRRMDFIGRTGVEASYEKFLRGKDGFEFVEVDARGREIGPLAEKRPEPPIPGKDIYLTIDHRLQTLAAQLTQNYERAAVVGIAVKNGEILCLLSRPQFDPNIFLSPLNPTLWMRLVNNPSKPFYNRAISSGYPPGSTFKPLTALAALKDKVITPTTTLLPCKGSFRYGNRTFKCWAAHGTLNLLEAIEQSCNVYFYQVGLRLNLDSLVKFCQQFGLGKPTGVDIPGENPGNIPSKNYLDRRYGKGKWSKGILLNFAIGQGEITLTPLQLATLYSCIANEGHYFRPHVVSHIDSAGIPIKSTPTYRIDVPLNKKDLEQVKRALTKVVEFGTGRAAQRGGVTIAGKTGTAQNPPRPDHAWFVGYAPAEDPEIVFAVLVENAGHGGAVAAPIVGELIRAYFSYER